jgi:pSer/pThr/pTyr-binding forkhead associated (FHA) protein
MSTNRRRFDGVQLRRSRGGQGLRVVFDPDAPTSSGIDSAENDPIDRSDVAASRSGRHRQQRSAIVKSVVLTVIGSNTPPVSISAGEIRIGAAPDNEIVIAEHNLLPIHVRVTLDEDGPMLRLARDMLDVRLNHRHVESLSFLHDGDIIEIAGTTIAVQIDAERQDGERRGRGERITRMRRVPPKYVLRGVTGSQFGKLIPIYGRLVIGRGTECDLVLEEPGLSRRHAIIESLPEGLFLRDLGSANGSHLNGARVRDAVLKHGDQIVLDSVRFLVQAIDQLDMPAVPVQPASPRGKALRLFGWLVVAAAIFLAGIATALFLTR